VQPTHQWVKKTTSGGAEEEGSISRGEEAVSRGRTSDGGGGGRGGEASLREVRQQQPANVTREVPQPPLNKDLYKRARRGRSAAKKRAAAVRTDCPPRTDIREPRSLSAAGTIRTRNISVDRDNSRSRSRSRPRMASAAPPQERRREKGLPPQQQVGRGGREGNRDEKREAAVSGAERRKRMVDRVRAAERTVGLKMFQSDARSAHGWPGEQGRGEQGEREAWDCF